MSDRMVREPVTGFSKSLLYLRIALRVAIVFGARALRGKLTVTQYLKFLRRSLIFLLAVRHSKAIRRGSLYKIHIYIPAYPTPAFFRLLEKFTSAEPGPSTVVFSMGRACAYHCPHCYQKMDAGKDLEAGKMVEVALAVRDLGTCLIDIEGGEPLLQLERVHALLSALDSRSEQWLNTTGDRLTVEIAERLVSMRISGVFVSLHSPDPKAHDDFTGVPGSFEKACEALRLFGEAGAFTAINCCLEGQAVLRGDLERLLDLARELRCDFIQVIHPKPSGGWLSRAGERTGDPLAIEKLKRMHLDYNSGGRFREYPSVAAQVFEEDPSVFGCTAGGVDRFYIGADGEVQPCEFLNISFGNVKEEEFAAIFKRMRSHFQKPGADWLCCTQAHSINAAIWERGLKRTPVPWEVAREIVPGWGRGEPTPLYEKLGIYGEEKGGGR